MIVMIVKMQRRWTISYEEYKRAEEKGYALGVEIAKRKLAELENEHVENLMRNAGVSREEAVRLLSDSSENIKDL